MIFLNTPTIYISRLKTVLKTTKTPLNFYYHFHIIGLQFVMFTKTWKAGDRCMYVQRKVRAPKGMMLDNVQT